MTDHRARYGPHNPGDTYIDHAIGEQLAGLGEVEMNYATAGDRGSPALLLIPGQTESWWGYEAVMPRLAENFQVFAVDLRGQGRSTRTPGRYTLDNMGNDLVRFIDRVIGRPTIVSGLSSGGVLSAWLSAYAKPGQIVAACYEDPPLFASEVRPATGPGIRQCIGPVFDLWNTYLGDQWSIGAWEAMRVAAPDRLPSWMRGFPLGDEPSHRLAQLAHHGCLVGHGAVPPGVAEGWAVTPILRESIPLHLCSAWSGGLYPGVRSCQGETSGRDSRAIFTPAR